MPSATKKKEARISIIAAVLGFIAKQLAEALSELFREGLTPLDRVSVFIEDIQFELPTISKTLLDHPPSQGELEVIGARFSALKETLTLMDAEANKIKNLARRYRILTEVETGAPYTLETVFREYIYVPLQSMQRQLKLPQILQRWADCLSRHRVDDPEKNRAICQVRTGRVKR